MMILSKPLFKTRVESPALHKELIMATYKGEEFKFPDESEAGEDVKTESKVEVEIEDDTPVEDRGRKAAPPPEDPTDEELSSYDEKVQARIKKIGRAHV